MPGKRLSFTLPVEPISPPLKPVSRNSGQRALVEAPGTAPGSEELIATPFIAIAAQGAKSNITLAALFSNRSRSVRIAAPRSGALWLVAPNAVIFCPQGQF